MFPFPTPPLPLEPSPGLVLDEPRGETGLVTASNLARPFCVRFDDVVRILSLDDATVGS